MLSLQPWTLFWTIFNVLILFLAMKKFLLKPVMDIIEKRESMIQQQLEEVGNARQQAEAMKAEYEKQLETARTQAADIITAARARAEEEHDQVVARTQKESQKMLEQAKADIKYEQEKTRQELQLQIADIAMLAVRKIVKTGEIYDTGSHE